MGGCCRAAAAPTILPQGASTKTKGAIGRDRRRALQFERLPRQHRHKAHRKELFASNVGARRRYRFGKLDETLRAVGGAERQYHDAIVGQLLEQSRRHLLGGGGDDDAIERRAVGAAGTSSAVWPCDCDDCAAVTASGGSSGAPSLAAGGGGFSAWGRAATFFVSVLATATDTVCCEDSARVPSGEVVFKESA